MKIDQSVKKNTGLALATSNARAEKAAGKTEPEKATSGDNVTLSPEAQAMAAQSGDKGAFDVSKVNEIKAAIANGSFQVNANRIADGLIDTVKDLISTRKG